MNHYLMIAGFFIIVTIAVASLEPFAPSLPSGPNNDTAASSSDEQVADSGGDETESDESDDNADVPTASSGQYDEAGQDRGK